MIHSVQFSSVAQSCLTLCDPMNRSMPGLPVQHQLPEFTQTHVHRVSDAIQLLQVSLDFLLLHSSLLYWKGYLFWVLVLEGLVSLHRTIQPQLLQHYWFMHRLGLLWYWMVCLGNEQRSFCRFWDCIQVLHFRLFCWPWWLLHFF